MTVKSKPKYVYYLSNDGGITFKEVYNLSEFCKENKLDVHRMRDVARGDAKTHKGWKVNRNIIRVEDIKTAVDLFQISNVKSYAIIDKTNKKKNNNVLAISDLHIPFENEHALEFVKDIYKKYDCNRVVFMGDVFDVYSLSRYTKSPSSMNVIDEFKESKEKIKHWIKVFPDADCLLGNHEIRINKKLSEGGIPREFVKSFNELFGLPYTWNWHNEIEINGATYLHGDRSGQLSHISLCKDMRKSIICAHTHFSAGIQYFTNSDSTIFALNCGCMINFNTYAFSYASSQAKKPVLGTGVVLGDLPIFIPMGL